MSDIKDKILELDQEQRAKFNEEVDICIHDESWYGLHEINYINPPDINEIEEIVYQEMVGRGELKPL